MVPSSSGGSGVVSESGASVSVGVGVGVDSEVEGGDARRWFEVTVPKTMAEESLSALRMNAFQVVQVPISMCMYICTVCMYEYVCMYASGSSEVAIVCMYVSRIGDKVLFRFCK